jgi:hypothetical protein
LAPKERVILILLLLLLPGPGRLFSEEGEEPWIDPLGTGRIMPLTVRMETSPQPQAPSDWTLTILADHPNPPELVIKPPVFPPSITLERVRVESRLVAARRWTAAEFLFTLHEPGPLSLLPFEVIAPGRQGFTEKLTLQVRAAPGAASRRVPVFHWEERPPFLIRGTAAPLTLRLLNWEAGKPFPLQIVRGRAPFNAILEEGASQAGPLYHFTLIPLDDQRVILGPWVIGHEGHTLTVPRLELPVRSAGAAAGEAPSGAAAGGGGRLPAAEGTGEKRPGARGAGGAEDAADRIGDEDPAASGGGAPEPGRIFFPLREEYRRILADFRKEWDAGRRAEGLGKLRTLERDSLLGPALAALRRSAERKAGLESTEDEKWKPWRAGSFILLPLLLLLFAGALWFHLGPRFRNRVVPFGGGKNSQKSRVTLGVFDGFKSVILFTAGILALILLLAGRFSFPGSGRVPAVLKETAAYRVPEPGGSLSACFAEGQPVMVHSPSGGWVYAEAQDGRSGWVPEDAVIPY